ncbi:MAG: HlyD family secretion protein, partial [Nitrospira sp.]|nr:HlyD family secretion protein [Nitrospira sp.]
KGDVIAELEAPDFEENLQEAKDAAMAAQLGHASAERALTVAEGTLDARIAKATSDLEAARADFKRWNEYGREDALAIAEMNIQSQRDRVQDQQEEIDQLQKLYDGEDLAKESQDIVLNRSRRRLAQSKKSLDMAENAHKVFLEETFPAREQAKEDAMAAAELNTPKAIADMKSAVEDMKLRLAKAAKAMEAANERVAEFENDKGKLKITAPHDGIVLSGGLRGNDGLTAQFAAGDTVANGSVVASVLNTNVMTATISINDSFHGKLAVGAEVKAGEVSGKVTGVGVISVGGKITVSVELDNSGQSLLHGAKAEITGG